jgi:hypothetical protein
MHHIKKYLKQNFGDLKIFGVHDVPLLREVIKFLFECNVKCVVDSANQNRIYPTTGLYLVLSDFIASTKVD